MKSKVIFHIDVDSFFVSAEVSLRPELINEDVAISNNKSNSVVLALSYSAKLKGAKVPMKIRDVRKYCPKIISIKPNYFLYENLSKRIFYFLRKNYSLKIEQASIDEWFLDVSHLSKEFSSPIFLAKQIQKEIFKNFRVKVSIGISYNKFLSKIATEIAKPEGIKIVNKKNIKSLIWPLDISYYIGIGKNLAPQLKEINILTIGDFAKIKKDDENVKKILKNQIDIYIDNANGIGDDKVVYNESTKSLGSQTTISNDNLNNIKDIYALINNLSFTVSKELEDKNLSGNGINIQIKYKNKESFTISKKLLFPIYNHKDIYYHATLLFNKLWNEEDLLLIGINIFGLTINNKNNVNISLFEEASKIDECEKNMNILSLIKDVNSKIKSNNLKLMREQKNRK